LFGTRAIHLPNIGLRKSLRPPPLASDKSIFYRESVAQVGLRQKNIKKAPPFPERQLGSALPGDRRVSRADWPEKYITKRIALFSFQEQQE
jgi:hypothetical protein